MIKTVRRFLFFLIIFSDFFVWKKQTYFWSNEQHQGEEAKGGDKQRHQLQHLGGRRHCGRAQAGDGGRQEEEAVQSAMEVGKKYH